MDQVEEVKQKIDIAELVGEYVQLKKAGRNFKGLCPFHGEKTPSFIVNPELQIYKCFGCSEGGDCYTFLQKMEGMEFGEALQTLAKRVGVTLVSYRPTGVEEIKERFIRMNSLAGDAYHYVLTKHDVGKKAREYLEQRGIGEAEIIKFKLGFAPEGWDFLVKFLGLKKNMKMEDMERGGLVVRATGSDRGGARYYDRFRGRIMFPLNNARGHTVGFAGRVMPDASEKAGGKYINSPETQIYHKGELLYGLDVTRGEIKLAKTAVIVEGEIDAIASYKSGVRNVVAIKGSALTGQQVELLRRICDTVILALDADLAGDAAARRGIEEAENQGLTVKIVKMKGAKDPGELAIENPLEWKKLVDEAQVIYDYLLESAVERHGLGVVGMKKIGRELLPVWARIPDEIVKAHYIKRLAEVLEVEEQDVRAQLKRTGGEGEVVSLELGGEKPRDRRERLEEYVVGLAVRADKLDLLDGPVRELIVNGFWRRVVEESAKYKGLSTKEMVEKLPGELRLRVSDLMMAEEELSGEVWDKEWKNATSDLEEIDIRGKIEKMQQGKRVETSQKEILALTQRLAELTRGK